MRGEGAPREMVSQTFVPSSLPLEPVLETQTIC